MKKLCWFCALFFIFLTASAQKQAWVPAIDSIVADIHEFVPKGWIVLDSAFGDLNKDQLADVAMVIQTKDTTAELLYNDDTKMYDLEEKAFPRILLIAFKKNDGKFHLALLNYDFIMRSDQGGMSGDPYEPIAVLKGALVISFMGGTSSKWTLEYRFRYQDHDLYLIGGASGSIHTVLGTMEDDSYNFLTGKKKHVSCDNVFDDNSKVTTEWKTFPKGKLKTLGELIYPMRWEVESGVYL